jgi:hypothetical protein
MKTSFLVVTATLAILSAPAFASMPSSDPFSASSNDQTVQSEAGQYSGDISHDGIAEPFADRAQQDQSDSSVSMNRARSRDNLQPPRMDAGGVPDPRI